MLKIAFPATRGDLVVIVDAQIVRIYMVNGGGGEGGGISYSDAICCYHTRLTNSIS
jgi:hypothetical protein